MDDLCPCSALNSATQGYSNLLVKSNPVSAGVPLLLPKLCLPFLLLVQLVAPLIGKDRPVAGTGTRPAAKPAMPVAICYTQGKRVFVLQPGASKATEWTSDKDLYSPALSPSGKAVAFTLSVPSKTQLPGSRYIAIVDTPGGSPRRIYGTPDHHCYGPVWSPDGGMVAFNNLQNNEWGISVVRNNGAGARDLLFLGKRLSGVHVVDWAKDGRSVYGIDFDFLYQVGLDGTLLKKTPVKELGLEVIASGGSCSLSPEGDRLLLGLASEFPDVDDEGYPGSVVFMLDLPSGKARRLTPEGMLASQPVWLPDGNAFLFRAAGKKVKQGVYRMTLSTGRCELIVGGAKDPSAARQ